MADYTKEFALLKEAKEAAEAADAAFVEKHGNGFYGCGFAWVQVRPGTSRIAKAIIASGIGRKDSYAGGVRVWNPGGSHSQCIARKEAAADAFAKVLYDAGYKAFSQSRLD